MLGLTLALLLIFGGMLYALTFILPSATITVAPASEPLRVNIPLKAVQDARLDAAAGIVPAQALSVQVAGDARTPTTGRSDEPAGKAKGRVVFINRTGREITVPAGTVLSTATGNNVQFATTTDSGVAPQRPRRSVGRGARRRPRGERPRRHGHARRGSAGAVAAGGQRGEFLRR